MEYRDPQLDARGIALAVATAMLVLALRAAPTVAPERLNTRARLPVDTAGDGPCKDFPAHREDRQRRRRRGARRPEDDFDSNARAMALSTRSKPQTEDNRSVLVTVRPHQDQSRVGCRVGWFGDEPLSKAILERIGIRLELLPPAPIPDKPPSSPAPNPFLLRDEALKDGMVRDMIEAPYRDRPVARKLRRSPKPPIRRTLPRRLRRAFRFSLANRGPRRFEHPCRIGPRTVRPDGEETSPRRRRLTLTSNKAQPGLGIPAAWNRAFHFFG